MKFEDIQDHYTDILAHRYEPCENGKRVACGTTMGKFLVLERDEDRNEVNVRLKVDVPNGEAVLGLDWSHPGVSIGTKNGFYFYGAGETVGSVTDNPVFIECLADVMDVRIIPNPFRVVAACDDGKVRVFDLESRKLLRSISDTSCPKEVLSANNNVVAVGGQDGSIFVYEADFRTSQPIWSFDVGFKLAPGLALSKDATWLATGTQGAPTIYNLRTKTALPDLPTELTQRIFTITFDDEGTLWWGGEGTAIHNSECLSNITSTMRTEYGDEAVHHIFSIATGEKSQLSVAGSSNGILFTDNGKYWDTYISL